jgi:hypothetical protein
MHRWPIGLLLALIAIPAALAQSGPLPDVPRDHPAAWAVATLWRADVVRGGPDGLFHGDEPITELEAIVLAARLSAAVNNEYLIRDDWTVDQYLARYWESDYPARGGVPLPAGHWAAMEWNYLAWVTPRELELLDGWPRPLPTRYQAALSAARVLLATRRAVREGIADTYAETMLPDTAINDTLPLDQVPWEEHMSEHGEPPMPVEGAGGAQAGPMQPPPPPAEMMSGHGGDG